MLKMLPRGARARALVDMLGEVGVCLTGGPDRVENILDFGCGRGLVLDRLDVLTGQQPWFAGLIGPRRMLYACDFDREAIELCRENHPSILYDWVSEGGPLPYRDDFFRLVYSGTFSRLLAPYTLRYTTEMARILTPGGVALVSHTASAKYLDDLFVWFERLAHIPERSDFVAGEQVSIFRRLAD